MLSPYNGILTKTFYTEMKIYIDKTLSGQDYKLLDFTGGGIGKPPSTPR